VYLGGVLSILTVGLVLVYARQRLLDRTKRRRWIIASRLKTSGASARVGRNFTDISLGIVTAYWIAILSLRHRMVIFALTGWLHLAALCDHFHSILAVCVEYPALCG